MKFFPALSDCHCQGIFVPLCHICKNSLEVCKISLILADVKYCNMKLKKRKIKYTAIFIICWLALLVFLVDGVLKFQALVDFFGSYVWTETALLLLVILPTWAVYKFTKE